MMRLGDLGAGNMVRGFSSCVDKAGAEEKVQEGAEKNGDKGLKTRSYQLDSTLVAERQVVRKQTGVTHGTQFSFSPSSLAASVFAGFLEFLTRRYLRTPCRSDSRLACFGSDSASLVAECG